MPWLEEECSIQKEYVKLIKDEVKGYCAWPVLICYRRKPGIKSFGHKLYRDDAFRQINQAEDVLRVTKAEQGGEAGKGHTGKHR